MKSVIILLILLVITPFSYAAGTDATSQIQADAEMKQNHLPTGKTGVSLPSSQD